MQIRGENNYPFTKAANERLARCQRKVRVPVKVVVLTPLICELNHPRERIPDRSKLHRAQTGARLRVATIDSCYVDP